MKLELIFTIAAFLAHHAYAWSKKCRDAPEIEVGCEDASDANGILRCELKDGTKTQTFVQERSGNIQTTFPLVASRGENLFFGIGRGVEGERKKLVVGEPGNGCDKEWLADYVFQGNTWWLASNPVGQKIGQTAPPASVAPSNAAPASPAQDPATSGVAGALGAEAGEVETTEVETPGVEAAETENARDDDSDDENDNDSDDEGEDD